MSVWTSNAIVSKAKAMYGTKLKENDYNELVKKHTLSDLVSYLRTHPFYEDVFRDIHENMVHRGQLEELIKKAHFNHTLKLIKFVELQDKKFYELYLIQKEIDLILATIRSIVSENFEEAIAEFPIFFKRHASFDITELSKSKNIKDLLVSLEKTQYHDKIYPFLQKSIEEIKYAEIETKLDECFYDCMFKQIELNYKTATKKELIDIYKTKIELSNIVKIYRLKKFYNAEPEVIRSSLITKYSRISDKKLDEIIHLPNAEAVLNYMESSEFAKYIDQDEYVYIEYYSEKMKYNLAKRYMYFSSKAPSVFSAYLILNEIERDNLFNIIEGIRYELDESEIRKMLIY